MGKVSKRKLALIFYNLVLIIIAGMSANSAWAAKITDTENETQEVSALSALYVASGEWLGKTPSVETPSLHLRLSVREGRVTYTQNLEVPFKDIRVWEQQYTPFKMEIRKKDGTSLILTDSALVEKDAGGRVINTLTVVKHLFAHPKTVQGEDQILRSLKGKAASKKGIMGEYEIPINEVKVVSFP